MPEGFGDVISDVCDEKMETKMRCEGRQVEEPKRG